MNFTAKAAKSAKDENELSRSILDAAFRVHSAIGPGLLEGAYEACLAYELRAEGFNILTQVPLPLVYREVTLDVGEGRKGKTFFGSAGMVPREIGH
ncbi:MAG TPA: GxxExxY protein [Candidatus Dormibacteraeota bacterium]|jgi:hypothetical protein|nr:GxxExxY protein [Candidatus Dormibacteraeota bacterium]